MSTKIINFIATGCWISYLPAGFNSYKKFKGAGLFGTLLAFLLTPLLPEGEVSFPIFLAVFCFFSIWISGKAFPGSGEKDNPLIVIDEVCGYWVSLLFIPRDLKSLITAFILFRFFDTLKPWPIKKIDAEIGGGTGIVLDDLLAGVYAGTLTFLLSKFI